MVAFYARRPDRSTGGKVLPNRNAQLRAQRPLSGTRTLDEAFVEVGIDERGDRDSLGMHAETIASILEKVQTRESRCGSASRTIGTSCHRAFHASTARSTSSRTPRARQDHRRRSRRPTPTELPARPMVTGGLVGGDSRSSASVSVASCPTPTRWRSCLRRSAEAELRAERHAAVSSTHMGTRPPSTR